MSDALTLSAFGYRRNGTRALILMLKLRVKSGTRFDRTGATQRITMAARYQPGNRLACLDTQSTAMAR
jgi:hypothetical protein